VRPMRTLGSIHRTAPALILTTALVSCGSSVPSHEVTAGQLKAAGDGYVTTFAPEMAEEHSGTIASAQGHWERCGLDAMSFEYRSGFTLRLADPQPRLPDALVAAGMEVTETLPPHEVRGELDGWDVAVRPATSGKGTWAVSFESACTELSEEDSGLADQTPEETFDELLSGPSAGR
jgi:hypothetical protein